MTDDTMPVSPDQPITSDDPQELKEFLRQLEKLDDEKVDKSSFDAVMQKVLSRLDALEVDTGDNGITEDFGHLDVSIDAKSRAKANRMNDIVRYMGDEAAENGGIYNADKWEIHEEVFDGCVVSVGTVQDYLRELPQHDIPGMKWARKGEGVSGQRVNANSTKMLKFNIEIYQREKDE